MICNYHQYTKKREKNEYKTPQNGVDKFKTKRQLMCEKQTSQNNNIYEKTPKKS